MPKNIPKEYCDEITGNLMTQPVKIFVTGGWFGMPRQITIDKKNIPADYTGDIMECITLKRKIADWQKSPLDATSTLEERHGKPTQLAFISEYLQRDESDGFFKLKIIGDVGVGKTSLIMRYTANAYSDTYMPTLAHDFETKKLDYKGKSIKLQRWDTLPPQRFRYIENNNWRGIHGAIYVCDITDQVSVNNIPYWQREVTFGGPTNISQLLVVNKVDIPEHKRQVKIENVKAFAKEQGFIGVIETSAKVGTNVDKAFETMVAHLLNKETEKIKSAEDKAKHFMTKLNAEISHQSGGLFFWNRKQAATEALQKLKQDINNAPNEASLGNILNQWCQNLSPSASREIGHGFLPEVKNYEKQALKIYKPR